MSAQELGAATWKQAAGADVVLVPVGATEQHGPHLPLDTDTTIAVAVAQTLAARHVGSRVAPPVSYGSSGEHQSFPGTSSIGNDALCLLLVELTRSLRTWTPRVVFINAHGGNLEALRTAVTQLRAEDHDVDWVACTSELAPDLHAGLTETSLMLHLCPSSVRPDLAEPGCTAPLAQILPLLATAGVEAVSANGVLGDPTGATAEHGAALFARIVDRLDTRLRLGGPRP